MCIFFFSSRRRHTRCSRDWSSDVCSSDLEKLKELSSRLCESQVLSVSLLLMVRRPVGLLQPRISGRLPESLQSHSIRMILESGSRLFKLQIGSGSDLELRLFRT